MGWVKGQSGNPSGRPKEAARLAQHIRERTKNCQEQADLMLDLMRDEQAAWPLRVEAAKWLTDRGVGKAPEIVAVLENELKAESYKGKLSEAEMWQLRALQAKARGEDTEEGVVH